MFNKQNKKGLSIILALVLMIGVFAPSSVMASEESINLYFIGDTGMEGFLQKEEHQIDIKENKEKEAIEALFSTQPKDDELYNPYADKGIKVNSFEIKDSIAYLDVSKDIEKVQLGSSHEPLAYEAIKSTLHQFPEIYSLELTIDGSKDLSNFLAHAGDLSDEMKIVNEDALDVDDNKVDDTEVTNDIETEDNVVISGAEEKVVIESIDMDKNTITILSTDSDKDVEHKSQTYSLDDVKLIGKNGEEEVLLNVGDTIMLTLEHTVDKDNNTSTKLEKVVVLETLDNNDSDDNNTVSEDVSEGEIIVDNTEKEKDNKVTYIIVAVIAISLLVIYVSQKKKKQQ